MIGVPGVAGAYILGFPFAVGFHPGIRVGILPLDQVRALAAPELLFFNVNTADDLARADELWRQHASSR